MAKSQRVTLITPVFRAAFLNIYQPAKGMNGGAAKYSVTMLFPKVFTDPTDKKLFLEMKAAASAVAQEFFQGKMPPDFKNPFRDGDTKPEYDGYAGHVFVSATTNAEKFPRPGIVDANRKPIIDPSEIYSGCYMRAQVAVFGYSNVGKGVSFGLIHLQKVRDGEPFSGRGKPEDAFDASFDGQTIESASEATAAGAFSL